MEENEYQIGAGQAINFKGVIKWLKRENQKKQAQQNTSKR
jgi:hypothetical protein